MKKYLFYTITAFILLGCNAKKQLLHSKIYDEIYNCQRIDIKWQNKIAIYAVRQLDNGSKLLWDYLEKLKYSSKNDTIYILEMDGIQGNFLFTVWNKNDTLSYANASGELLQTKKRLFTKHMMKLVSEWNIAEIKKEEEINSDMMPCETIYASEVIFNKGKYHIDCICFRDFFNLQRDRNDFR